MEHLQAALLRAYVAARAGGAGGAAPAPASVARTVAALRAFGRFLAVTERLGANPAALLRAPRVGRKLPHYLETDALERLLAAPQGDGEAATRDRAILEVLYSTGLRVGELVALHDRSLDLIGGVALLRGKGRKERLAPLGRPAVRAFEAYRAVRDAAHGRDQGGRASFLSVAARQARRRRRPRPQHARRAPHRRPATSRPPACRRAPRRTPCATPSPPTSCRPAPTSAPCRSCSGTAASTPRRSTRT